ncbi:uncharacterized protein EAF02_001105 [Botrytis sinoallii]|uniref:uncharacterized protein n=1 Tax=Botrytis sinoallii TaxID=1463999 RepID=UPI0019016A0E|nr:uncharacterized protein EAF02_001105 [Botrytis sinoallii]KAF7893567.1 hypothetical protein EAF02_001105 [Botrytis sinoallii]
MGSNIWSEKPSESLPQYSRLPQQEQADTPSHSASRETPTPSDIFSYIRFILYSIMGIAFITSFLWAGPTALREYLNAPSSSSSALPTITNSSAPTINLIIASFTSKSDSSEWTKSLKKDNLAIIRYDSPASTYKGSEALIYLNYLYQSYDNLPSVSIFLNKWEATELSCPASETDLINRLDLATVQSQGFLPFCFQDASSMETNDSIISLFHKSFPEKEVPNKFSAPCNEFAVSRDAIRSVPREQYLHLVNLLRPTCAESDAGKEWDVMWPYLFLQDDTDEVTPSEALCRGWGICLGAED